MEENDQTKYSQNLKTQKSQRHKNKKQLIVFMSVTYNGYGQRHDIAFITDEFKFYFYTIKFSEKLYYISYINLRKIRRIFSAFDITEKTEITFQDTVKHQSPLFLYFKILHQYVKFNFVSASLEFMLRAIFRKHKGFSKRYTKSRKTDKKFSINKTNLHCYTKIAWDKLVASDTCPWISKTINDQLNLITAREAKHQKHARLFIYYMFIKKQNIIIYHRCKAKRLAKQNLTT